MVNSTGYLRALHTAELRDVFRTFCFGYEIDVLHCAFFEDNGPVRIIFAYGRIDIKAARQFRIDLNLVLPLQLFGKLLFYALAIHDDKVVERLLALYGIDADPSYGKQCVRSPP